MSKKLIAGAGVVASFAIALAPLATFADIATNGESDTHTDHHIVNINASCTFGKPEVGASAQPGYVAAVDAATHNAAGSESTWTVTTASDGTGRTVYTDDDNYDSTTDDVYNKSVHTSTITVDAGSKHAGFATTTLAVVCNNDGGYTVKAAMGDLQISEYNAQSRNYKISPSTSYSANTTGYAIDSVAKTTGANTATVLAGENAAIAPASETPIFQNTDNSLEAGDTWTITYGLGIGSSQHSGTYAGDVVYTLYKGVASV